MYRVQVMNKIAPAGLRRLDPGRYQVSKEEARYEGMIRPLCRPPRLRFSR